MLRKVPEYRDGMEHDVGLKKTAQKDGYTFHFS
jgi:hypothetical protein